ncbi:sortase [Streptomyces sp. H10-C2]|uniref:sortase n=1 Tax=unclassified Streptomyces TaxID=2593676 RepID=UPI0024B9784C|nr:MULTISPECIES: sortase [unclassified Streptomyces]MDJ0342823.1 sortase [Streptomyces sp. PH10-H1]MDJ0372501.1 sortase [Streptomyces sp. H10-C2]
MPNTPDSLDPSPAGESATARPGTHRLALVAAAATAGLGIAAALWTQTGHQPAAGPKAAPRPPATSQVPDPLTTPSAAAPDGAAAADTTAASRTQAVRALTVWGGTNPAGNGIHAVGGNSETGPGGPIGEVLRIPVLGASWAQPVYDGVSDRQLRAGIGHFPTTEQPGQIGNFAVAGHRSGVTDPAFQHIDRIQPGAAITVTTAHRVTYTYTVTRVRTVAPDDVDVIAQVPDQPTATPTTALLTLVTCWPATGHSQRVVVEARLVASKGGTQ